MISVSMDQPDKNGELRPEIRIKGDPLTTAMMLTVLVKKISEIQPIALGLHAELLKDPDFMTEVRND